MPHLYNYKIYDQLCCLFHEGNEGNIATQFRFELDI